MSVYVKRAHLPSVFACFPHEAITRYYTVLRHIMSSSPQKHELGLTVDIPALYPLVVSGSGQAHAYTHDSYITGAQVNTFAGLPLSSNKPLSLPNPPNPRCCFTVVDAP